MKLPERKPFDTMSPGNLWVLVDMAKQEHSLMRKARREHKGFWVDCRSNRDIYLHSARLIARGLGECVERANRRANARRSA